MPSQKKMSIYNFYFLYCTQKKSILQFYLEHLGKPFSSDISWKGSLKAQTAYIKNFSLQTTPFRRIVLVIYES